MSVALPTLIVAKLHFIFAIYLTSDFLSSFYNHVTKNIVSFLCMCVLRAGVGVNILNTLSLCKTKRKWKLTFCESVKPHLTASFDNSIQDLCYYLIFYQKKLLLGACCEKKSLFVFMEDGLERGQRARILRGPFFRLVT